MIFAAVASATASSPGFHLTAIESVAVILSACVGAAVGFYTVRDRLRERCTTMAQEAKVKLRAEDQMNGWQDQHGHWHPGVRDVVSGFYDDQGTWYPGLDVVVSQIAAAVQGIQKFMAATDATVERIKAEQALMKVDLSGVLSEFNGKPDGVYGRLDAIGTKQTEHGEKLAEHAEKDDAVQGALITGQLRVENTLGELMSGQQGARDTAIAVKADLELTQGTTPAV